MDSSSSSAPPKPQRSLSVDAGQLSRQIAGLNLTASLPTNNATTDSKSNRRASLDVANFRKDLAKQVSGVTLTVSPQDIDAPPKSRFNLLNRRKSYDVANLGRDLAKLEMGVTTAPQPGDTTNKLSKPNRRHSVNDKWLAPSSTKISLFQQGERLQTLDDVETWSQTSVDSGFTSSTNDGPASFQKRPFGSSNFPNTKPMKTEPLKTGDTMGHSVQRGLSNTMIFNWLLSSRYPTISEVSEKQKLSVTPELSSTPSNNTTAPAEAPKAPKKKPLSFRELNAVAPSFW